MKKISFKSLLMAGLLVLSATFAQAAGTDTTIDCNADGTPTAGSATICILARGSSAAKAMGTAFVLNFFDSTQPVFHYVGAAMTVTTPTGAQYVFASGDLNAWTGTLLTTAGGGSSVIRYSPTHSMDGYAKLECQDMSVSGQLAVSPGTYYSSTGYCGGNNTVNKITQIPMADVDSQLPALDYSNTSCTGAPVTKTATTLNGTITYTEYTGCTLTKMMGTTMGAADVDPNSFHQRGPATWSVYPLDASKLSVNLSFFIPFQFAVSNTLVYTNPATNTQTTPVLSHDQAIALLSNNVSNWNLLPGYSGNNAQPILCLRNTGSGTKGALNNTILKGTAGIFGEAPAGLNVYFNFTTGDLKNCITTHPYSIGYMNADSLPAAGMTGVVLDGILPYADPHYVDVNATVKDGIYPFFTEERLAYRAGADPSIDGGALTGPQHTFMNAFITNAVNNTYLTQFGAGKFWVAPANMCSTKLSDGGTLKPTAGATCPAQ